MAYYCSPLLLNPLVVAFAGHTVLSSSFPWNQSTFDNLIGQPHWLNHSLLLFSLPILFLSLAFAGHTVLSSSFPWNQSTFDGLIMKQLMGKYSAGEMDTAQGIAVPIAAALLRER
jgi:hypothetical protein